MKAVPMLDNETGQLEFKRIDGQDHVKVYDPLLKDTTWQLWDPPALSPEADSMMGSVGGLSNLFEGGLLDVTNAAATVDSLQKLGGLQTIEDQGTTELTPSEFHKIDGKDYVKIYDPHLKDTVWQLWDPPAPSSKADMTGTDGGLSDLFESGSLDVSNAIAKIALLPRLGVLDSIGSPDTNKLPLLWDPSTLPGNDDITEGGNDKSPLLDGELLGANAAVETALWPQLGILNTNKFSLLPKSAAFAPPPSHQQAEPIDSHSNNGPTALTPSTAVMLPTDTTDQASTEMVVESQPQAQATSTSHAFSRSGGTTPAIAFLLPILIAVILW